MVDSYGKNVGKYTVRPMDPMGNIVSLNSANFERSPIRFQEFVFIRFPQWILSYKLFVRGSIIPYIKKQANLTSKYHEPPKP